MSLFQKQNIILHSGEKSDFKIDCDALTNKDIECIAYLISKKFNFCNIVGVPNGGVRLQNALKKYVDFIRTKNILICDDVLTTGASMEELKKAINSPNILGVVIFARGECPKWVTPIFTFNFNLL